jgi:hypothetical protein
VKRSVALELCQRLATSPGSARSCSAHARQYPCSRSDFRKSSMRIRLSIRRAEGRWEVDRKRRALD